MVNANVIVSVSLLSVAALTTLAVVYNTAEENGEELSTIGELCEAIFKLEGEEYEELHLFCDGLDEEFENVGIEEDLPCDGGDGGTDDTWTLAEILLSEDPNTAYNSVMSRCIGDVDGRLLESMVQNEQDRRTLEWADRNLEFERTITPDGCVDSGEQQYNALLNQHCKYIKKDGSSNWMDNTRCFVGNVGLAVDLVKKGYIPSYGLCGSKCDANVCYGARAKNMRGKTSYCSDGYKGGERCKNKLSWKCCAEHDKSLADGSSCDATAGRNVDMALYHCVKNKKVCRSGHWWCSFYAKMVTMVFANTPNNYARNGPSCNAEVCKHQMNALQLPQEATRTRCTKRRWGRCRRRETVGKGYTNTGGKW